MDTVRLFSSFVSIALNIYLWVHIAAMLLSWVRADENNLLVQIVNRLTHPLWNWVGFHLPFRFRYISAYGAILVVLFAQIFLPGAIRSIGAGFLQLADIPQTTVSIVVYALFALLMVSYQLIHFILILSVIWFILTLVNPPLNNPIVQTIMLIVDPLITPLQRVLPRTSIDLSPLALAVITYFLGNFLSAFATRLQPYLIS